MAEIHPTAIVHPDAVLGNNVSIGPYSIIEDGVQIGDDCRLGCHVIIKKGVNLGPGNTIEDAAVIGGRPQHLHAGNDIGSVRIGSGNTFREHVTVHCGFKPEAETVIGDGNLLMVGSHVAHDVVLGSHCIVANNVLFGGHAVIDDHAYVSGGVAVHQFGRVGSYTMVGGGTIVTRDVPPYVLIDGITSRVVGLNTVGLKRKGFSSEQIKELKAAYRVMYRSGLTWGEVLAELSAQFPVGPAAAFHQFLQQSTRGCMLERRVPKAATISFSQAAKAKAGQQSDRLRKVG